MALSFLECPKPTLGAEVEVQLIDRTTKDLAAAAEQVLERAERMEDLRLKSELTVAMVEINTGICGSVREVAADLSRQMGLLRGVAASQGLKLAVSGTHPFQDWRERKIFPDQRHTQLLEKFQWLARRWTTFGLHVHVGVKNGERAISIMNALISYIPHLLALSASSPFWGGTDTGLASCRAAVTESFPTGGLPYYLPGWKEFEKYFETLKATGAIESIKDLYWDIRPHYDFGTIEVRICDGIPTLHETLALVALVQCLVVWIDDQLEKGGRASQIRMQRYWVAPENKWQAVRYGLEGQIITKEGEERRPIREEIEKLLEILRPVAASLGCAEELSWVRDILRTGSSSSRQRRIYSETRSLKAVVDSLITELQEDRPILEWGHGTPKLQLLPILP
jgi:glutamate---cysteine ligase / carboxylate-amine ligase